jgi:exosome complex RNA-binding protein Rrp4
MAYFEKQESYKGFIKVLTGIIAGLIILNLLIVKSLISVASNKTIQIQVPQHMDSGEYVIGNTFASEDVYKMWVRVWAEEIASFSYKDIDKRYESIYPFLDAETAFKSKSEMIKFMKFVQINYVTQTFAIKDVSVEKLNNGYMKIIAHGTVKRSIGNQVDELNGMRYAYEFTTYVRNGQVYINSITSKFEGIVDAREREKLKENKFVNFEEVIQ